MRGPLELLSPFPALRSECLVASPGCSRCRRYQWRRPRYAEKLLTWGAPGTNQLGCAHGRKVCADGLHGFRYLRLSLAALPEDAPFTTGFGTVPIASISLQYSGFLGTPDTFAGYFECSDRDVTQWWYDGVYTADLYDSLLPLVTQRCPPSFHEWVRMTAG